MRFDVATLRPDTLLLVPSGARRPSPLLRRAWLLIVWPGLRTMLRVLSLPLALLIGLPAWLFTLACVLRTVRLVAAGHLWPACTMFLAAWVCGTLASVANWPRRNL